MKQNLKIILGLLFTICLTYAPNQIFAQEDILDLKEIDRFCFYDWLSENQDSINIVIDEKDVNQTKYCVVTKIKGNNYDLHCWKGNIGMESPTKWDSKLKIKFRRKQIVTIIWGEKKVDYQMVPSFDGKKFLLIKK